MSLFPRSFCYNDQAASFTPLFRLLDDFESYSRANGAGKGLNNRRGGQLKTFSPKFDVTELADTYELHGELPGIDQNNIEIEFTDHQTLTIRGHSERSYTSDTAAAASVEAAEATAAIPETVAQTNEHNSHQATVEDEKADEDTTVGQATPQETPQHEKAEPASEPTPKTKFWVSERSVGSFARSFTFPVRIDQEQVQASMKDGILRIQIPKDSKQQSRKITIA